MRFVISILSALHVLSFSPPGQSPDLVVSRLSGNSKLKTAAAFIETELDRTAKTAMDVGNGIPALAGAGRGGTGRAQGLARVFRVNSLRNVEIDAGGNVLGLWKGETGPPLVAVAVPLDSTPGVHVLIATLQAFRQAHIETGSDLLFMAYAGHDAPKETEGIEYFFLESPFRKSIRWFIGVSGLSEDIVSMAPNTIGSTIVQTVSEVMRLYGMVPQYNNAIADAAVPVSFRIPSVKVGAGGTERASLKSIQIVMTTVLALSGIR